MKKIKKIKHPGTLQALVYDQIKDLLISGQQEFDAIYSANKFAEILGVSRTPVREALLQLSAEGLLIPIQGRGFKIKEFSEKQIRDFFETRKMIEAFVIERLMGVITEKDLGRLEDSLKQMVKRAKVGDIYGFLEADKAFHMNLIHRYDNRLLVTITENIRNLISIFGQKALSSYGRTQEVIYEHQSILDALNGRDGKKAVEAMIYHLNTTERYLIESRE